jgi:hypothetical protein
MTGAETLPLAPRRLERLWRLLPRRRPSLGVRPTAAPGWLFVLLGVLAGPRGIAVLTPGVLREMQPVTWVALAVIGVFVGMGAAQAVTGSRGREWMATGIVTGITVTLVAGGLFLLATAASVPVSGSLAAGALIAGLAASASAALDAPTSNRDVRRAARLADLDDIPVLVAGAGAIAWFAGDGAVLRSFLTLCAGGTIALAGCLLFERADESERGTFLTGAVLLLAGAGAYLGTSPLLAGAMAGVVWVRMPGTADRITTRDLSTLQHPLVALLLVVAGALVEWTLPVLWMTAALVVLRLAARLLASMAAARAIRIRPALLATALINPGTVGIALAVNAVLTLGPAYQWLAGATAASALVLELFALLIPQDEEDAS